MSAESPTADRKLSHASGLSPRSAARISTAMLFTAGICTSLAAAVMLVFRYSPIETHISPSAVFPLQIALIAHVVATAAFLLAAGRMRRRTVVRSIVPRLLAGLLSLCFIGSVDLIVGIFYPPAADRCIMYDRHLERGWTNRPNGFGSFSEAWNRFDERGLRIHEDLSDPDPPGRTHILFVGDSVTMGYYVPARSTYGWLTARILNERLPGYDFSALNGGVCGYDTAQERNWFAEEGVALNPDLVVLQFCMNDVTAQFDPALKPKREQHIELALAKTPNYWSGIHRAIFEISRRLTYSEDRRAAARKIEHFELEEVLRPDPAEKVTRAWQYVFEELAGIHAIAQEHSLPLMLVIFPIDSQLENLNDPALPQRKLKAFAESEGIICLDLLPVYRQAIRTGVTSEQLFADETHPTREGHRVAAEAIADFISQSSLLKNLATTRTASSPSR